MFLLFKGVAMQSKSGGTLPEHDANLRPRQIINKIPFGYVHAGSTSKVSKECGRRVEEEIWFKKYAETLGIVETPNILEDICACGGGMMLFLFLFNKLSYSIYSGSHCVLRTNLTQIIPRGPMKCL